MTNRTSTSNIHSGKKWKKTDSPSLHLWPCFTCGTLAPSSFTCKSFPHGQRPRALLNFKARLKVLGHQLPPHQRMPPHKNQGKQSVQNLLRHQFYHHDRTADPPISVQLRCGRFTAPGQVQTLFGPHPLIHSAAAAAAKLSGAIQASKGIYGINADACAAMTMTPAVGWWVYFPPDCCWGYITPRGL